MMDFGKPILYWNVIKHKEEKTGLYMRMRITIGDMQKYQSSLALLWVEEFTKRMHLLPRKNHFSAWMIFKAVEVDNDTIEIWKVNLNSEFVKKLFTVNRVK